MPGYYLHLAACGGRSLENRSFVLGVEAPDLLKKHIKFCGGLLEAKTKYNSLRTSDMPEYCELQPRILQKETANSTEGLHYGLSSNPDIIACWSNFSDNQKSNPFYRGYIWHLLTDALIYRRLDINSKFQKFFQDNKHCPEIDELLKKEVEKLHNDWNKINTRVRSAYPNVTLPDEIIELGLIQFISDENLVYVDWSLLKTTIDYLRTFNPIGDNMEAIIRDILRIIAS